MNRMSRIFLAAAAAALTAAVACSTPGDRREVTITIREDGCSPTSISASAGEKLTFLVKNEAKGEREIEGVEGTRLEEVLIPSGRTRQVNYTVPREGGSHKVKCYMPGGPSTIIEVRAAPGAAAAPVESTVDVELGEWTVKPSVEEVKAGRIRFLVRNKGGAVHELAVVTLVDGKPREIPGAEIEDLKPGDAGDFIVELRPGRYELACLVQKGEFNSPVDHYEAGMHASFVVR